MKRKRHKYIIGIDEVGRGALAGPVVVAAVAVKNNSRLANLRDSKKLSLKKREIWFEYVKSRGIDYATAKVSAKVIDKINVSNAANLAAARALNKLITNNKQLTTENCKILLDGGLFVGQSLVDSCKLSVNTVVRGDEKIPAIMLASIVAKVSRDRLMKKFHDNHPQYDFNNNVGYPTKNHRKAIKKHACLSIHRKSFKIKELT